jgi:hypothetical protein
MATNEAAMDQETAELIASIDACFERMEQAADRAMVLMREILDDLDDLNESPEPPRESEPAEVWDLDLLLGY